MGNELERLEIEKVRLECDKLRAEIAEASVAWWRQPGYLASIVPILIAVVGFLSVWSTGFFDTQRATLKSEIEGLKTQEIALQNRATELASANAEVQQRIDEAYLRLKLSHADASYALSHLRGIPQKDELVATIVTITEQELKKLDTSLGAIPASTWAAELTPFEPDLQALRAPDGRIYNLADRKFYAAETKTETLPR
jgi:hypothetical protein